MEVIEIKLVEGTQSNSVSIPKSMLEMVPAGYTCEVTEEGSNTPVNDTDEMEVPSAGLFVLRMSTALGAGHGGEQVL
ncbi:unnamed protein product [Polarella glacialis]|uniref:Uncharacterized protein n=1 Tax=Polarella glacialis TaxID=89957 RepID=A0A813HMT7_POLGL|nr:unnamed protein product [Polarella glacialis]